MANKKRAPPNFSWLESYRPSETEAVPGTEPEVATVSMAEELDSCSSNNCRDARPAHSIQMVDSTMSSPDVTIHRPSIATGICYLICY